MYIRVCNAIILKGKTFWVTILIYFLIDFKWTRMCYFFLFKHYFKYQIENGWLKFSVFSWNSSEFSYSLVQCSPTRVLMARCPACFSCSPLQQRWVKWQHYLLWMFAIATEADYHPFIQVCLDTFHPSSRETSRTWAPRTSVRGLCFSML